MLKEYGEIESNFIHRGQAVEAEPRDKKDIVFHPLVTVIMDQGDNETEPLRRYVFMYRTRGRHRNIAIVAYTQADIWQENLEELGVVARESSLEPEEGQVVALEQMTQDRLLAEVSRLQV